MTKAEKIQDIESKAEVRRRKAEIRKRRAKGIRIGFAGAVFASVLIGIAGTSISDKEAYSVYKKNPGIKIDEIVFRNDDGYRIWQENALHNDINCLLGGGNFYDDGNGTRIAPASDCNSMELTTKASTQKFSDSLCSYLNVAGNVVYYRKDTDRSIYMKSLTENNETVFYSGNVGEVYLYGDYLYFVDLADDRKLFRVSIEGNGRREILTEEAVDEFVIYGDQCVYLTTGNSLYYKEINEGTIGSLIPGKYNRFFFNGHFIAQSGGRILCFEPEGGNSKLLYEGDKDAVRLIGAGVNCFYLQEADNVKRVSMDQGTVSPMIFEGNGGNLSSSLLETKKGLLALVFEADDTSVKTRVAEFCEDSLALQKEEVQDNSEK